jgi:phosphoenolpyruvate synthase/pyruvate phosphate dikinase
VRKRIFQAQNRARLAAVQKTARVNSPLISAGKALSDLRRAVEEAIQRLAMNEPQAAAVFYRKLEQSAPEDLQSLLADLKELDSDSKPDETQNHG